MTANGPAVCFSRRNPTTAPGRVLVPRASGATKLSRCKECLARVFAVLVQILLSSSAVAVQIGSEPRIYHRLQSWSGALAQCRDTKMIEARNCQGILQFNWKQIRVSGCKSHYKSVMGAGAMQKP